MKKVDILGVNFSVVDMNKAIDTMLKGIESNTKVRVYTPNPEIVMVACEDDEFKEVLNDAELVLPDGIGVVIASKILGAEIKERVAGYDTVIGFLKKARHRKIKVFLLGAAPGVALKAKENIEKNYIGINVVGVADGYFTDEQKVIDEINQCSPDIVLVGLGAPKQEKFINEYYKLIDANVFVGCGGSIDVIAGVVKRAPDIYIKLHIEWLYRAVKQPKRFKRTLKLPLFLIKVIKKKIFG